MTTALLLIAALGCTRHQPPGPHITTVLLWPGADLESVEELLVRPVEQELMGLPGVSGLEAQSTAETGIVTVRFASGTAPDVALHAIRDSLKAAEDHLPADCDLPPSVRVAEQREHPRLWLVHEDRDLLLTASRALEPSIAVIPDVAAVTPSAVLAPEVQILLDPEAARRHGLSGRQLSDALLRAHTSSPDDLAALLIPIPGGGAIPLQEIATFTMSQAPTSHSRRDGTPAVWLEVETEHPDAVRAALKQLDSPHPDITLVVD